MVKHVIYLEYGATVISIGSGAGMDPYLRGCTVTQCVNSGTTELIIGSVCSTCVEATIHDSRMRIREGMVFNLFEVDDAGSGTKVGRFKIKTSRKSGHCIYKITAYDAVIELDRDLSSWLHAFDFSQHCTLLQFARAVCTECGVPFVTGYCPNDDFIVGAPIVDQKVTGRKLLQWCAEIACRYCRATEDGSICFDWYGARMIASHSLHPTGNSYYFGGSLSYGEYDCLPVDAVVIEQSDGALWPEEWDETVYRNPLIIKENMLLLASSADVHTLMVLQNIKIALDGLIQYRSCKVSCPASRRISIGDALDITDASGFRFSSLVMSKVQSGQKITLECYGSSKRQN